MFPGSSAWFSIVGECWPASTGTRAALDGSCGRCCGMCCPCGCSSHGPGQDFWGRQQSAPPQLTHPYRTVYHPHHSVTAPLQLPLSQPRRALGIFPTPLPARFFIIFIPITTCFSLSSALLYLSPKLRASQPSQGLHAPCSRFPWEG